MVEGTFSTMIGRVPHTSTFLLLFSIVQQSHMDKQNSVWEGILQEHVYRKRSFGYQFANNLSVDMFNIGKFLVNKEKQRKETTEV